MKNLELRCYCCGEKVLGNILICSYGSPTDRVFIFAPQHGDNIDDTCLTLLTARMEA